jgi:folate-binding protein YgfZ
VVVPVEMRGKICVFAAGNLNTCTAEWTAPMTDTAVAATLAPTPMAAKLDAARVACLVPYRGVLTPAQLDVPTAETAALVAGAAVHDLGWLRGVRVHGEDRFRWLSGMVTNTVNDLPAQGGAWNLVLNAQGRIQGDLTVWRGDDHLSLEIAADQYEKLMAHFDHFIIMDDVELVPLEGLTAIGLTGPNAGEVLKSIGIAPLAEPLTQGKVTDNGFDLRIFRGYGVLADHYALWGTENEVEGLWNRLVAAGAQPVGATSLEAFRIAEGIPAYGIDIAERDLPQEVMPQETWQMRALHFNKGCYLGQEIVERIRSRGNVHRHLRQVEIDGLLPEAGTELTLDGAAVGAITSAAALPLLSGERKFALAMLRAEAETKNLPLNYATAEGAGTTKILSAPPVL